jgi:hypothetical protein
MVKIKAEEMPPTTTIASGFWAWDPIGVARATGSSPRMAVSEVMATDGDLDDRLDIATSDQDVIRGLFRWPIVHRIRCGSSKVPAI